MSLRKNTTDAFGSFLGSVVIIVIILLTSTVVWWLVNKAIDIAENLVRQNLVMDAATLVVLIIIIWAAKMIAKLNNLHWLVSIIFALFGFAMVTIVGGIYFAMAITYGAISQIIGAILISYPYVGVVIIAEAIAIVAIELYRSDPNPYADKGGELF